MLQKSRDCHKIQKKRRERNTIPHTEPTRKCLQPPRLDNTSSYSTLHCDHSWNAVTHRRRRVVLLGLCPPRSFRKPAAHSVSLRPEGTHGQWHSDRSDPIATVTIRDGGSRICTVYVPQLEWQWEIQSGALPVPSSCDFFSAVHKNCNSTWHQSGLACASPGWDLSRKMTTSFFYGLAAA